MSDHLNVGRIAPGSANPEVAANDVFERFDAALTDFATLDLSQADAAITTDDAQKHAAFLLTGAAQARTVTLPAIVRALIIGNDGTAPVTITRGTASIAIPAGATVLAYLNGTATGLRAVAGGGGASGLPSGGSAGQTLVRTADGAAWGNRIAGPIELTANVGPLPDVPGASTVVRVSSADGLGARLAFDGFGSGGNFVFRTCRGTASAPLAVTAGFNLGQFSAFGYGATGYTVSARAVVSFLAAENWTDIAQGCRVSFRTTPVGSATNAEIFSLEANGAARLVPIANDPTQGLTAGLFYFNATSKVFRGYDGTAWSTIGGGVSGDSFPSGGAVGQVLKVASVNPRVLAWAADEAGSGGGSGGTTPTFPTAPYWRVYCLPGSGFFSYCFAGITFLDSTGNAIPTTSGTPFGRPGMQGAPAKAFDNNLATYTEDQYGNSSGVILYGQYLGFQFDAAATVAGVSITARNDAGLDGAKQVPEAMMLQYSLDGKAYKTVLTFGGPPFDTGETRTFQI